MLEEINGSENYLKENKNKKVIKKEKTSKLKIINDDVDDDDDDKGCEEELLIDNLYSNEILCKDKCNSDENIKNGKLLIIN